MPAGGKLTIETANVDLGDADRSRHLDAGPGSYVMLAVTDTGVGIDADTAAQIFDPFFTTKPEGVGTGLGLSTVYGIIKQSGGDIGVHSTPGSGTTFRIYLPQAHATLDRYDTPPLELKPPRGSETILLVEDEELVRNLEREVLEECGYTVLEATSAKHALQLAANHRGVIELLLTDVVMPELSGRELAEQLLAQRPEMRILYASGYFDDAIAPHGVLDPGIALLSKPLTPTSLARKVRDTLDSPAPQAERTSTHTRFRSTG
jgi:CheY-like chemotaxis protein